MPRYQCHGTVYNPELVRLWYKSHANHAYTLDQFVALWMQKNRRELNDARMFTAFPVRFYTRPNKGGARQVVIDPNERDWFQRFVYDVHTAAAPTTQEGAPRTVKLVHNGHPLTDRDLERIRNADHLTLQVILGAIDGTPVPATNPRVARVAAVQAALDAKAAQPKPVEPHLKVPILRVARRIADEAGAGMGADTLAANARAATPGSFVLLGDSSWAYAHARSAIDNPANYAGERAETPEKFWAGHGVRNYDAFADSLSHSIARSVGKTHTIGDDLEASAVTELYKKRAINSNILVQWTATVKSWWAHFTRGTEASTTAVYSVDENFGVAVADDSDHVVRLPMRGDANDPRYHGAPVPHEHVFEPQSRARRGEERITQLRRFTCDREMLYAASTAQARPVLAAIAASVASSDSMPGLRAINATVDSMPGLRPIESKVDSMPALKPAGMPALVAVKAAASLVDGDEEDTDVLQRQFENVVTPPQDIEGGLWSRLTGRDRKKQPARSKTEHTAPADMSGAPSTAVRDTVPAAPPAESILAAPVLVTAGVEGRLDQTLVDAIVAQIPERDVKTAELAAYMLKQARRVDPSLHALYVPRYNDDTKVFMQMPDLSRVLPAYMFTGVLNQHNIEKLTNGAQYGESTVTLISHSSKRWNVSSHVVGMRQYAYKVINPKSASAPFDLTIVAIPGSKTLLFIGSFAPAQVAQALVFDNESGQF